MLVFSCYIKRFPTLISFFRICYRTYYYGTPYTDIFETIFPIISINFPLLETISQKTRCDVLEEIDRKDEAKSNGSRGRGTDLKEALLRNDCAEWDHGIRRNSLTTQFHDIKESGRAI